MSADNSFSDVKARRLKILVIAAAVAFVYLPSRLYVLHFVKPAGTDTDLYARYAYIHRIASERRTSFHELYREEGLADMARSGRKMFDSQTLTAVAYPPFAVSAMMVPALFIQRNGMDLETFTARYKKNYRWLCAAAETAGMAVTCLLVIILYGNEKIIALVFRMSILCLAGLCMPRILYDRLDVILGALIVFSLAMLIRRATILSYFILALAVNFKLVPVFLFPVWILGSFRVPDFNGASLCARLARLFSMAVTRGAALCLLTAGVGAFFYCIEGKGVFEFLRFHLDRGIHVESIWGTFSLLSARLSGTPVHISYAYGAYNVITPAVTVLSDMSFLILTALLTAATAMIAARLVLRREWQARAQDPGAVVEAALLFLCLVYSVYMVFSPQYLLVLVPLVALLPYTGKGAFVVSCLFIGVCCISTVIYPLCYSKAILSGPTWFGLYLLTARMLLLAGMAGILFLRESGRRGRRLR